MREMYIKAKELNNVRMEVILADIKDVYVDNNMFCCFYSFYKHYENTTISDEYFKDCIRLLKLMYLKRELKFKLKFDIALYENIYGSKENKNNIDELNYSLKIFKKIDINNIEDLSKEKLYMQISKIIKKHKNKPFLLEKGVKNIYDYWYNELTKGKKYLNIPTKLTDKTFKSLLKQLIKSQENKEINSMTILFILNSFADKDLNKKRKQFIKESKDDFIRNACFDMVVISYGIPFKDTRLFSKDKALQNYCIKLYKNLNELSSFIKIIETICIKNNIQQTNEIKKLSTELFNKLNNN